MITNPILGNKLTPEQRQEITKSLAGVIDEMAVTAGSTLKHHILQQSAKLTDSELLDLTRGGIQLHRLVRTIIVVSGGEHIVGQFNAESIIPDVRRLKRWMKNRY